MGFSMIFICIASVLRQIIELIDEDQQSMLLLSKGSMFGARFGNADHLLRL